MSPVQLFLEHPANLLGLGREAAGRGQTTRKHTCFHATTDCNGGVLRATGRRFSSTVVVCFNSRLKDAARFFHNPVKLENGHSEQTCMFYDREDLNQDGGRSVDDSLGKRAGMATAVLIGLSLLNNEAATGEAMARLLPAAFPWEKTPEQLEPSKGTCATCIGVVDDTLGACNATVNCVSSFDDRPKFFVAPWEFPGSLPVAVAKLRGALLSADARIDEQGERYVHAVFTSKDGIVDDVEFLFSNPREDATVVIRSASRATTLEDKQRNRNRLEDIRKLLSWEQVPVLRNRKRLFFFLESPWDTFGPEPPPSFDYKDVPKFESE